MCPSVKININVSRESQQIQRKIAHWEIRFETIIILVCCSKIAQKITWQDTLVEVMDNDLFKAGIFTEQHEMKISCSLQ